MKLETERLYLREMTRDDFPLLCKHLQDEAVMYAWEHAYSDAEVWEGIEKQFQRYKEYGFGVWAVILKENEELIGQCGLSMQPCEDREVLEIGYIFQKKHWHKGYATEAAATCREYAFDKLNAAEVFSLIRDTNIASQNVALRNGMSIRGTYVKHYRGMDMPHYIFSVKRGSLTENMDTLHTTPMGRERIKHNLKLETDDVVLWCKEAVKSADMIIGQGKNWYVYRAGAVITINKHSHTIITAHKINPRVRAMRESDYVCLSEFLYQAIFIPEGVKPPPRSIINEPEIFVYIKDFGTGVGDLGVVAEQNGQVVGAAWTRVIPAYGHIDSETPELAISIFPEFRGYGAGTKLMKKLFELLRENGYRRTSLSVQTDNPAVRFYERLGYKITGEKADHAGHEDYIMIKELEE